MSENSNTIAIDFTRAAIEIGSQHRDDRCGWEPIVPYRGGILYQKESSMALPPVTPFSIANLYAVR